MIGLAVHDFGVANVGSVEVCKKIHRSTDWNEAKVLLAEDSFIGGRVLLTEERICYSVRNSTGRVIYSLRAGQHFYM